MVQPVLASGVEQKKLSQIIFITVIRRNIASGKRRVFLFSASLTSWPHTSWMQIYCRSLWWPRYLVESGVYVVHEISARGEPCLSSESFKHEVVSKLAPVQISGTEGPNPKMSDKEHNFLEIKFWSKLSKVSSMPQHLKRSGRPGTLVTRLNK